MKRELVKTLPYNEVDFKWICSHWDIHLNGSCMVNGCIHEFVTEFTEEGEEEIVKIYKLNLISKLKWYWRQLMFEKCIGYHWTYRNKKRRCGFYYRKPEWLYVLIFNLYYKKL